MEPQYFGKLIASGEGGYIFENPKNKNRISKLVPLRPYLNYEVRDTLKNPKSYHSKRLAINELQANLFRELFLIHTGKSKISSDIVPSGLPKVYLFAQGETTQKLRDELIASQEKYEWGENALQIILNDVTHSVAFWVMEKVPCVASNGFCGLAESLRLFPNSRSSWVNPAFYEVFVPEEQREYENTLDFLYRNLNMVVRDVKSVDNFGIRDDGTFVFFDPIPSLWPITESMEDSGMSYFRNRYDLFVRAFGEDQISKYSHAIRDGTYFRFRHGIGLKEAEGEDNEAHEQVVVIEPVKERAVTVDIELLPLLRIFWNQGISTTYSCQGDSDAPLDGYIMFDNPFDTLKIIEILEDILIVPAVWDDALVEVSYFPEGIDSFLQVAPLEDFPDYTLDELNERWWAEHGNTSFIPYKDESDVNTIKINMTKPTLYFDHEILEDITRAIYSDSYESEEVTLEPFDITTKEQQLRSWGRLPDTEGEVGFEKRIKEWVKDTIWPGYVCPECGTSEYVLVAHYGVKRFIKVDCFLCHFSTTLETVKSRGDVTLTEFGLSTPCPKCGKEDFFNRPAWVTHVKKCGVESDNLGAESVTKPKLEDELMDYPHGRMDIWEM